MQTTAVKSIREENAPSNDIFYMNAPYQSANNPVVVYYPVGNYNELKEFGRFKNLGVAMTIISNFNNPDNHEAIPEYKIFSLGTGAEIFPH